MKTVLFACVHNAGRSQMAAGIFHALADPAKARAISAGTHPAERVHPEVITVMREIGIDLGSVQPRLLTESLAQQARMLVTMGCAEQCPFVAGLERIDWQLSDPQGERLESVRAIRDEVKKRVVELLAQRGWQRATSVTIRQAREEDFPRVMGLLEPEGLPLAGVREHWHQFIVAEEADRVVGAVGLEIYGSYGLLRSLVVDETARKRGVGQSLVAEALSRGRNAELNGLFLLTTTAADFFSGLGFERINRQELPRALEASRELQGACPATAIAMRAKP